MLQDLFEAFAKIDDLTVFWGTTGCSLRVAIPGRSPLSDGWLFPPGPQRWMGLTDVTLGWYEDANGLALPPGGQNALNTYRAGVETLSGGASPKSVSIRGRTFPPAAVMQHAEQIIDAVREVALALVEAAANNGTATATEPGPDSDLP